MAEAQQPESPQAKLVPFARRKLVHIEPELKDFLDECIIPLLIDSALAESKAQIAIESESPSVADCERNRDHVEVTR
jgi:hypothetical protein